MPVISGLLSFRNISISLQRWANCCRHPQSQPDRGDTSVVAFDMPPARGLPGMLVKPSLNLQQRTETHLHPAHSTRLLNPHFFHFSPFLVSWLSANRYIFPSQCPIHPLTFIPQCCHCLFHITGHRSCNYLANSGLLLLAEQSRRSWWWEKVLFSNNQGKWVTPERMALNASAAVERGGVLWCNMWFSGSGGQSLVRKSAEESSLQWKTKRKLLQPQEIKSLLYLEAPWVWKLFSA